MPVATRTFRVFISSTFEDLKAERDALQREVFPKLRKLCEAHGARFQAIDLRWGVRDEAALDQRTMEICLAEIERCQRTGIKPNFIVLLGERYGWRPLPARIEAKEFDAILGRIPDAGERTLVENWYRRDENAVPPEYLLKPRSGEFVDRDRWQKIEEKLGRFLRRAAQAAGLPSEALVPYLASATHQEILKGLGATKQDREHVFAFFRSRSETREDPELRDLKQYLRDQLRDNVFEFQAGDIAKLCKDAAAGMERIILSQVSSFESRPALELEIEAHDAFAQDRARHFTGRQAVLSAIAGYLRSDDRRPLVLFGASGSGKSAIMAKASVPLAGDPSGAITLRRFIGATPDSSRGLTLLHGLCEELAGRYGRPAETPMEFNLVVNAFKERLAFATAERPLHVFVDALDQLSAQDPAHALNWLPAELPPHCCVIVSTIEVSNELRQARAAEVGGMTPEDADEALAAWLRDARRTLRPQQQHKLLSTFSRCPLPLYLKLAFEEARLWRSFERPEDCVLGEGLAGIIDVLLGRLSAQSNHGPVMVSRSLSYLAAARFGLTEDEILNILTNDDEVWGDFDRRKLHDPQGRQLPVIVWSRLFLDLEPYLTERAAPGGTVASFYHRQFSERVAARFLAGDEYLLCHRKLAEQFAGQSNWLDANKSVPNLRRLTEMVRHQVAAAMYDEAEAALTDFDFLSAKCRGGLVLDCEEDYREAIAALPEAQPELQEEARRQAEAARWTREIIEYSRQWTTGEGRPPLPAMIHSVRLWTDEEIAVECKRITENPTRLDRLKAFARFVEQELYPLIEFGVRSGFVAQQGFNSAPAGPVHEAAERALVCVTVPLLTRAWSASDSYNPKPALLRTLEGGAGRVSVTPDGQCAVSGSGDRALRVWDLTTGACLRALEGHAYSITSLDVTPDGRQAASTSGGKTIRVWDLTTGTCRRVLKKGTEKFNHVSLTPDGRQAVSASDGMRIRVWDLTTGVCLRVLEERTYKFEHVSITPDGKHAVCADLDRTVRVWDLETGACQRVLNGHTDRIESVSITPDCARAVSAGWDKTVRVWDLEAGASQKVLEGHKKWVESVSMTPDGRRAVSSGTDDTVRAWNLETGACLRILEGHMDKVESVSVTPDGRRAVSTGWDETVRVWDLEMGASLQVLQKHKDKVARVCVTPDGRHAVSGSWDSMLRVWDLETGTCLRVLEGHSDAVYDVSVSPDGRRAVSASQDKTIRVWDLETGTCMRVLRGHAAQVTGVCITPDCRRVVSASGDYTVQIWNLETGTSLRVLDEHMEWVWRVMPDGRRAVSAGWDNTVRIWDLETETCLRVLGRHTGRVGSVSITPDGRHAVSASWDRTVRIWDLETETCLRVLEGHTDWVESASATPDGKYVVSASCDKTVRVWDLEIGACVAIVHLPSCTAVAISPQLDRVIVGTSAGEVLRFDLRGMTMGGEGPGAAGNGPKIG